MAANVLHNYNQNPYKWSENCRRLVVFNGDGHYANKLILMSPISLRVMLTLAARLNEKGYASATLDELARYIQTPRSYVNKGILELAKHNLIRKKKRGEYWIQPEVFKSFTTQI